LLEWEFTKRLKEMEPDISPHQVIKDLLRKMPKYRQILIFRCQS